MKPGHHPPEPLTDEEMQAMYDRWSASSASSMSYGDNPWKVSNEMDGWLVALCGNSSDDGKDYYVVTKGVHASTLCGDSKADAEFIAAMPRDFKRLFKEVLRLRELQKL